MSNQPEIVVVGAGIAGSALAAVLARRGREVAVLERESEPVDRVRGEFLVPWGVAEARELGLLDVLHAAGGFHAPRMVSYDENSPLDEAEARARDLSGVLPGIPGPLCCAHPAMCTALAGAAEAAGATVVRGTANLTVTAAERPAVGFDRNGRRIEWRPRLVVGADGRDSAVRRQVGIGLQDDAPHNYIGGLLVDGVPQWPRDTCCIGTEGELNYFVFPQGAARLRLYACWSLGQGRRFAGAGRRRKLLEAFGRLACLRHAEAISQATPAGPFNAFANQDRWTDEPTAAGIVLVGDAAGHNDPIAGQGLAIALRDVRMLRDALDGTGLSRDVFAPYVAERAERMRRLRVTARLLARLRAEFGAGARARRERALRRTFAEGWPSPIPCTLVGPERLPSGAFDPTAIERLVEAA